MANKSDVLVKDESCGGVTRRDFLRTMTLGSGAALLFGNVALLHLTAQERPQGKRTYKAIVVDYQKCAGCRTCETVCAAFNHPREVDGEMLPGLGNPYYANIRVHPYNPDVDIPNVCAMCADNPCIEACPVEAHPQTGRRALYRDPETLTIKNDPLRCIGCGSCAQACREKRLGVIVPHPQTNKPERMCTLCDGDPQCVKHCPYDALAYLEVDLGRAFYRQAPDEIARELIKRWYGK